MIRMRRLAWLTHSMLIQAAGVAAPAAFFIRYNVAGIPLAAGFDF